MFKARPFDWCYFGPLLVFAGQSLSDPLLILFYVILFILLLIPLYHICFTIFVTYHIILLLVASYQSCFSLSFHFFTFHHIHNVLFVSYWYNHVCFASICINSYFFGMLNFLIFWYVNIRKSYLLIHYFA